MTTESLLIAILAVLTLILILTGLATVFLVNTMRAMRAEQGAMRRAISSMDWTTVLGQGVGAYSRHHRQAPAET